MSEAEFSSEAERRRFRPYPKYKDSGIEWLGEIPAHWIVKKIKRLCLVRRGASPRPIDDPNYFFEDGEYAWVRIADVSASDRYLEQTTQRLSPLGVSKSVPLEPGELFVSIAATVGKPIITRIKCCIHDGFVYFVGLRENREYLFYTFSCGEAYKGIGKLGTQLNLNTDTIGDIYLPSPSPEEQNTIVSFLDRETAKIDALFEKEERLIELLQEKRTALITQAVNKGLDPTVPMEDSGVEWLGKIPAHWEIIALSRVTLSRCDGPFGSGLKSEHYSEAGVRVIRLQNIGWTEFSDADQAFIDEDYANELGDHSVMTGDLLIAGLGDEKHPVGRACVSPDGIEPAMVKADCFCFRLDRRQVVPQFAAYQLSATALAAAGALATGATRARMNLTLTASRKMALPPPDEQRVIVEAVEYEGEKYLALCANVREAIDRLKEYRTALISAAVTGKIDIRCENS